ncbi:MAG: MFS transporter, partial [Rhodobacteraceae bacterium]|nr:MFS transporter [Paracoccaceae bacterium]
MNAREARRRIWGWWMFDFANQPYSTLLMTFIFAPYFASAVVSDPTLGQQYWGWMLAISGLFIALMAPILGAIADSAGPRRPWLLFFSLLYVIGAAGLWVAAPGTEHVVLVLVLFAIGMMGLDFGIIFTNAYLPELGRREELGAISGTGWAVGYGGGVLALIVMLLIFAENEAGVTLLGNPPPLGLDAEAREGTRMVGPLSALWYVVFALPFFLWVPDVARKPRVAGAVARGMRDLWGTLRNLPRNRSLAAYLGGSMLYRDGLNGIFAFGGIYAAGVLGWSIVQIGVFGILAAVVGIVGCWFGGRAARRVG